ncbi:hypothetical protein AVEN_80673-1, partial [Araneus ventricosus]
PEAVLGGNGAFGRPEAVLGGNGIFARPEAVLGDNGTFARHEAVLGDNGTGYQRTGRMVALCMGDLVHAKRVTATATLVAAASTWNCTSSPVAPAEGCVSSAVTTLRAGTATTARRDTTGTTPSPSPTERLVKIINSQTSDHHPNKTNDAGQSFIIISANVDALIPSFHQRSNSSRIKFFVLLSHPPKDFVLNVVIISSSSSSSDENRLGLSLSCLVDAVVLTNQT